MLRHLLCAALTGAALPLTAAEIQANAADALVDTIGVNIHTHYQGTVYDHPVNLKAALQKLGVRHVRDGLVDSQWATYYERLNDLGRSGIKATLITGFAPERVLATAGKLRDAIEALEGPNEVNLNQWTVERARRYQQDLWSAVRADPMWRHIPIVCLSVTDYDYGAKLGDLSPYADFGNIHPYAGGWEPENGNDWMKADLKSGITGGQRFSGAKPMIITEIGYTNHRGQAGHVAVPPEVAGVYLPRVLLNTFSHGVTRTFIYELFDLGTDPHEQEHHFGLVHNDGVTFKPAGTALMNLVGVFADAGPGFIPKKLDYALSDAGARHLLFQRRDGDFLLALWLPTSLWDQERPYGQKRVVDPPDRSCTVKFLRPPQSLRQITGFDTTLDERPMTTAAEVTVTLSERLLVLRVTP
jgi:hypothetical protein